MEDLKTLTCENFKRSKVFKHGKFMKKGDKQASRSYRDLWIDKKKNKDVTLLGNFVRNSCRAFNMACKDYDF
jgi:hypothetical protein